MFPGQRSTFISCRKSMFFRAVSATVTADSWRGTRLCQQPNLSFHLQLWATYCVLSRNRFNNIKLLKSNNLPSFSGIYHQSRWSFIVSQLTTKASCLDAEHSNRTVPGWQTAPCSRSLSMKEGAAHCLGPEALVSPSRGRGTGRATGSGCATWSSGPA